MSSVPAPDRPIDLAEIVSRLRAAGCVFAEDEADLLVSATTSPAELAALVTRRLSGEPLEYVLGWAAFYGLRIVVDPGVFVPRLRTEFLVSQAAHRTRPGAVVIDLCCGCGAVAAALESVVAGIEIHAADLEPAAIACARRNMTSERSHLYEGDLFDPLPSSLRGRVDVLVANVPYVPTDAIETLPPEARLYEPRIALDGGADGLDVVRRVTSTAGQWLAPGGHLLIETSDRQSDALAQIFTVAGLATGIATDDELGATVVIGTLS